VIYRYCGNLAKRKKERPMIFSERVKAAMVEDLVDAVRMLESVGLYVMVGTGRIGVKAGEGCVSELGGAEVKRHYKPRKSKTEAPVVSSAIDGAPNCAACGVALKTGRGTHGRKLPLCKMHSSRWSEYKKREGESGYALWLERQKLGGRQKKATAL
jgi:hypothetical protein